MQLVTPKVDSNFWADSRIHVVDGGGWPGYMRTVSEHIPNAVRAVSVQGAARNLTHNSGHLDYDAASHKLTGCGGKHPMSSVIRFVTRAFIWCLHSIVCCHGDLADPDAIRGLCVEQTTSINRNCAHTRIRDAGRGVTIDA